MRVHTPRTAAEAGYLRDLLSQHGIQTSEQAGAIVVTHARDEARARALVLEVLADEDDDTVRWPVRVFFWGRRLLAMLLLLLLAFAVTSVALGRADALSVGVVAALLLVIALASWRRRRSSRTKVTRG